MTKTDLREVDPGTLKAWLDSEKAVLIDIRDTPQQPQQEPLALEDRVSAKSFDHGHVADELYGVAQALLGSRLPPGCALRWRRRQTSVTTVAPSPPSPLSPGRQLATAGWLRRCWRTAFLRRPVPWP